MTSVRQMGPAAFAARRAVTTSLALAMVMLLTVALVGAGPDRAEAVEVDVGGPGTASATIMVAVDGDDDGEGTPEDPFATIGEAIDSARAGDVIEVRGGRYEEDVQAEPAGGDADAPIVLRGAAGEQVVLAGRLWLRRPHHWHLQDLEITWRDGMPSTDHLVKLTGGRGWAIDDSVIRGARAYSAVLVAGEGIRGEPADWSITDSCISGTEPTHDVNQDHLLYVNTGLDAGAGLVAGNVLVDAPNGSGVKLGGPEPDEGGSVGVEVSRNVISGTVNGVIISGGSTGNVIAHNRFSDLSGAGIRAFRLTSDDNVAVGNVSRGAPVFSDYDSPDAAVADESGNRMLEQRGGAVGCEARLNTHFTRRVDR